MLDDGVRSLYYSKAIGVVARLQTGSAVTCSDRRHAERAEM
jgi:hypothetical protein